MAMTANGVPSEVGAVKMTWGKITYVADVKIRDIFR
jgi:hypothetical protein